MAIFESLLEEPHPGSHVVQFYEADERVLTRNVVRYCAEGLTRGECALLVTTPEHAAEFTHALTARGFEVDRMIHERRIVLLDARQTLNRFLIDGYPDASRFEAIVGSAVREALAAFPAGLRAYGEMVGLLWQDGQFPAAVRLEQLWHKLLEEREFSLFCAYPIDIFTPQFDRGVVDALLSAHTHLFSAGRNGDVEVAVEKALGEITGTTLAIRTADMPSGRQTVIPRGEELILWVRRHFPDRADEILGRAREIYCGSRTESALV
ncbi:MAG: MEDS domain-containing protein [Candidatus Eremiobacteraeota bacterium]|nr:MEDS domain-containing protein [Candidatus Eremiobacteraeota bacterium]